MGISQRLTSIGQRTGNLCVVNLIHNTLDKQGRVYLGRDLAEKDVELAIVEVE